MEYGKDTYADRLFEKGFEKGFKKGIENVRTNTILRMLNLKTDEEIHELTGYPMAQIQEIRTQHSL